MAELQQNDDLLKEIRDNFEDSRLKGEHIRKEAAKDMRFVAGDPWEKEERDARENAKRPVLAFDEINQYVNQVCNDQRQNKPAIQVKPKGNGATDQTAAFRAEMIRGIEYESKAQSAYIAAFESAVQRSYGWFRVSIAYDGIGSFNRKLQIKVIPNPDTIFPDWDFKEMDASDMNYLFATDIMRKEQYKKRFPKAKILDFTALAAEFPIWIKSNSIQVAEYWKMARKDRTLLLLDDQGKVAYLDEFKGARLKGEDSKVWLVSGDSRMEILQHRKEEVPSICQYFTNGVEILSKTEWAGSVIPFIPVFGRQYYMDDGSGSKRHICSLVRMARDPQMLYAYYRSTQCEVVGMSPKTKWVIAEGQLEGHEDEWKNANRDPIAYLAYKATTDATGGAVLPAPQRVDYEPPIQALEMGAESARRAIQAAMGISSLPTAAQRRNEKSGVALEKIEQQQSQGSYHFTDGMASAVEKAGRICDELLGVVYDTARDVGTQKPDESYKVVRINDPSFVDPETKKATNNDTQLGDHGVTVSVGPSYQSQREQASDFVDHIITNLEQLPLAPEVKAKLMAQFVRLKNIGPIGDTIIELLDPQDKNGQAQNQLAQAGAKMQEMQQAFGELQAELQKLQMEKAGKVVDNEYKLQIEKMKLEVDVLKSEITTKAQKESERDALFKDMWTAIQEMSHEAGTQGRDHAHDMNMAQMNAANSQAQLDQSQGHEAAMAAQSQENDASTV